MLRIKKKKKLEQNEQNINDSLLYINPRPSRQSRDAAV